LLKCIVVQL